MNRLSDSIDAAMTDRVGATLVINGEPLDGYMLVRTGFLEKLVVMFETVFAERDEALAASAKPTITLALEADTVAALAEALTVPRFTKIVRSKAGNLVGAVSEPRG
jgi:hypothetical protein